MSEGKKYLRSTDHKHRDNVRHAVLVEKIYYVNDHPVRRITGFDPRMQYTYLSAGTEEKEVHCPNCGYVGSGAEMADGCPACGTAYNVEYSDKELGAKYHYDQVVNGKGYKIRTMLVDVVISFFLSFFLFRFTGRTFNIYDIGKVVIGTAVLSLALYYVFYQTDAYIVSAPARREAEKRNRAQKRFWETAEQMGISKKDFFNNVLYELREYYYGDHPAAGDVLDFDVVDFLNLDFVDSGMPEKKAEDGKLRVRVSMLIREISFNGGRIQEKSEKRDFVFEKSRGEVRILQPGRNIIKCPNCGASADVSQTACSYCGAPMKRYQPWRMILPQR
jgi:rubrerythrin